MVFLPSPGVDLHPSRLGLEAEDVFLDTEDGVRIHAFWISGPGSDRAFLFLHGNAGNASHRLPNAARLRALGAHVLLLDYRGYGLSEGRPSEQGVYLDARAAREHLVVERGVEPDRIVLFGRSIGASVAVELARHKPLAGVILESAFTSAEDIARGAFGWPLSRLARGRFDSASKIHEIEAPLLFFHGDADEIAPIELGRALYRDAPEPKAFEIIHGAGHNDTVQVGGAAYFRRIGEFLDRVTGG
jgi:pimeloyl-ACP methyl ester carboxylesterase